MEELHPIHSFIVKIWLEETIEESGRVVWRGRITHVPSGRQKFIIHLKEITQFIKPYLKKMGGILSHDDPQKR